jgi:hypothetical protein
VSCRPCRAGRGGRLAAAPARPGDQPVVRCCRQVEWLLQRLRREARGAQQMLSSLQLVALLPVLLVLMAVRCHSLDNGVGRTPMMGWMAWCVSPEPRLPRSPLRRTPLPLYACVQCVYGV